MNGSRPWIKTLLLTVIFFTLIVGIMETLLRSRWMQAWVDVPYPTQGYRSADDAFRTLDAYTWENGNPDCIFLGSSLVAVGIYPAYFEEAYKEQNGVAITCFNFGVSVATASSMGPLAHILVDLYRPKILIIGTAPRSYVERASYAPEENFQNTPWAQYHLGRFNLQGWALEHFYTFRLLAGLPGLLFPAEPEDTAEDGGTKRPEVIARGTPGNYAPLLYFNPGAPLFSIRNREPVTRQRISQTYEFSEIDFTGFKQVIELGGEPGLILVVVEMPSPKLFFSDPEGAPQPSEESVFRQVVAGYARQHGVSFWMTNELNLIPFEYFADSSHLYVSGAIDFSRWLGRQVGAAVEASRDSGGIPEEFVERPPLDQVETERDYLASRGMDRLYRQLYQDYLSHYDPVQSAVQIINPQANGLDPEFVQTILGFYIQGDTNIDPRNVEEWFALMAFQERMLTMDDDRFSAVQKQALSAWYGTRSPDLLLEAGVDFLLYTENWDRPETAPQGSPLDDPANYRLIRSWEYAPLRETYYLYLPLDAREPGN